MPRSESGCTLYSKNVQLFIFCITVSNISSQWPIVMIFGTLNPEKISCKRVTDLSTSPVRYSHFTLGNPTVIFNKTHCRCYATLLSLVVTGIILLTNNGSAETLIGSYTLPVSRNHRLAAPMTGSVRSRLWLIDTFFVLISIFTCFNSDECVITKVAWNAAASGCVVGLAGGIEGRRRGRSRGMTTDGSE